MVKILGPKSWPKFEVEFLATIFGQITYDFSSNFFTNFNEFLDQILCHNFGPQLNKIFRQNLVHSEKILDNLSDQISD